MTLLLTNIIKNKQYSSDSLLSNIDDNESTNFTIICITYLHNESTKEKVKYYPK